jgi:hypothetical protein
MESNVAMYSFREYANLDSRWRIKCRRAFNSGILTGFAFGAAVTIILFLLGAK